MDESTYDDAPPIIPSSLPIMKMVLPHHKEENEWGPYPLEVELPYDLALTTHLYLEYAYPVLNMELSHNALFMRPERGSPMEGEHLSTLWQHIQALYPTPWTPFPPSAFRDIHVGDKVMHLAQAVAATGVELRGDAAVMLNTAGPVWQKSYCKGSTYFNTMVQGTVDRMTAWRHDALESMQQHDTAGAEVPDGEDCVMGDASDLDLIF
jgi:hypothetical protein